MLAAARTRGAHEPSVFRSYALSLPAVAPDAASWPRSVRAALLSGTDLLRDLGRHDAVLADLHHRLRCCPAARRVTRSALRWAHGMWRSRMFSGAAVDETAMSALSGAASAAAKSDTSPHDGAGGSGDACDECEFDVPYESAFLPVLDYLNHASDQTAALSVSPRGVTLVNTAPLAVGEQAFHCYGATRANEELLSGYVPRYTFLSAVLRGFPAWFFVWR